MFGCHSSNADAYEKTPWRSQKEGKRIESSMNSHETLNISTFKTCGR